MVTDYVKAPSPAGNRPIDHIGHCPVMADEIEIGSSEHLDPVPQIADDGQGLEKHLGHQYRRTQVKIGSTFQFRNLTAE